MIFLGPTYKILSIDSFCGSLLPNGKHFAIKTYQQNKNPSHSNPAPTCFSLQETLTTTSSSSSPLRSSISHAADLLKPDWQAAVNLC